MIYIIRLVEIVFQLDIFLYNNQSISIELFRWFKVGSGAFVVLAISGSTDFH